MLADAMSQSFWESDKPTLSLNLPHLSRSSSTSPNPSTSAGPLLADVYQTRGRPYITHLPKSASRGASAKIEEDDHPRKSFYLGSSSTTKTRQGQSRDRSIGSSPADARRFRGDDPKQSFYPARPSKSPSGAHQIFNGGQDILRQPLDATAQSRMLDSDMKSRVLSKHRKGLVDDSREGVRSVRQLRGELETGKTIADKIHPSSYLGVHRQHAESDNRTEQKNGGSVPIAVQLQAPPRRRDRFSLSHDRGTSQSPITFTRHTLIQSSHTSSTFYSNSPPSLLKKTHNLSSKTPDFPVNSMSGEASRKHSSNSNSDHVSFIDFLSPPSPETTLHDTPSKYALRNSAPASPRIDHHDMRLPLSNLASLSQARSRSPKPPISQTPKPTFHRQSPSVVLPMRSPPTDPPRNHSNRTEEPRPPTTNFLNAGERADLVRKSRKLAQMFGQTPTAEVLSQQETGRPANPATSLRLAGKSQQQRGALSISDDILSSNMCPTKPSWPPAEGTLYLSASGRRHSSPLSPEEFSFLGDSTMTEDTISFKSGTDLDFETGSQKSELESDGSSHQTLGQNRSSSPTSFIDLSGDVTPDTPNTRSPSAQSISESLTPEEQAEEERRRKRDKVAKLHRFLGSRIPTNLVLGLMDPFASLPPPEIDPNPTTTLVEDTEASHKAWLRRRRSSSVAAFPSTWSDDLDRLKEDLNDEEKAINVRRAQKMEKVFGVAPPQTLYHTRHSPSSSPSKTSPNRSIRHSFPVEPLTFPPSHRNLNQSAYVKRKSKNGDRPGTSDSNRQLLDTPRGSFDFKEFQDSTTSQVFGSSNVFTHYQHSLNSLNDIIDRDDAASLAELHQYLNDGAPSPILQDIIRDSPRRVSAPSIKSERRRSLPTRTSMLSIASEYSVSSPKPDLTDFQLRRRRAAKLVQFFGADYRVLIQDVLESIEKGLEDERKTGSLRPAEAEELLEKLRRLRTKRDAIF